MVGFKFVVASLNWNLQYSPPAEAGQHVGGGGGASHVAGPLHQERGELPVDDSAQGNPRGHDAAEQHASPRGKVLPEVGVTELTEVNHIFDRLLTAEEFNTYFMVKLNS